MLLRNFINFKLQVRYDESGEGVGARDPLEGIKAQKGEVSKRLEDMKAALEQQKAALSETKNRVATLQGQNLPEITKKRIEFEGAKKSQLATVESYKRAIADFQAKKQEEMANQMANPDGNPSQIRDIYDSKIQEFKNTIDQILSEIKKYDDGLNHLNEQLDQVKQAIAHYQNQIQQLQQAIIQIQSNIAALNAQKKGLEIQLKHMAGAVIKQREIQSGTRKKMDAVHAEQGAVAG